MPEKKFRIGRIKWSTYDPAIQAIRGIIETYDEKEQDLPFMVKQEAAPYKFQEGQMVQYVKKDDGIIPQADDIDVV